MTITNKTTATLKILGRKLKPGKSRKYEDWMFNTIKISSEIGNCVITIEYGKKSFKNHGKLVAMEGNKRNEHGIKDIIITSIN